MHKAVHVLGLGQAMHSREGYTFAALKRQGSFSLSSPQTLSHGVDQISQLVRLFLRELRRVLESKSCLLALDCWPLSNSPSVRAGNYHERHPHTR